MKTYRYAYLFSLALGTSALLAACGGGGGGGANAPVAVAPPSASAPAPIPISVPAPIISPIPAPPPDPIGQATVWGTITGFGSVIVDGIRIDDSAVAAGRERNDGSVERVELKLGQHVEIEHDGKLVATRVRVISEAEGTVSTVATGAGTLTVAGQAIIVNTDPSLGPVTIFDGYASLADIRVGDRVEVHGTAKTAANGQFNLQATRIEKTNVSGGGADSISGVVTQLSATGRTFQLGNLIIDYSAAQFVPAGAVIANSNAVRVAIPSGTVAGNAPVKASLVLVRERRGGNGGREFELGGVVSTPDAAAKTFTVNGVKVDASAASFGQAGQSFANLISNTYIVVKGAYASDGTLKATRIVLRGIERDGDGQIELHGSVTNFAPPASFTVRNVRVDATGVRLDANTCGNAPLANDLQVEVKGSLNAAGLVKAVAIKCENVNDDKTVFSRVGSAGNVNTSARTFSLTTDKGVLSVDWNELTLFRDVTPETLSNKKVQVEGPGNASILHATKISLEKD